MGGSKSTKPCSQATIRCSGRRQIVAWLHGFIDLHPARARARLRYFFSSRQAGSSTLFDGSFGEIALRTTNPLLQISGKVSRIDVGSPKSMVPGGPPPALPLERTRDTRGLQKLISNTRTEACALSFPLKGAPLGERPPPRRGVALFALCKRGRARGASSRGHHQ